MIKILRQAFLSLLLLSAAAFSLADDVSTDFRALAQQLNDAGFREKADIATQMAASDNERVIPLLSALLEGQLYSRKDNDALVILGDDGALQDAFSGEVLDGLSKRDGRKINVNNSLRGTLRSLIAQAQINSRNADVRYTAALNFLKNTQDVDLVLVESALQKESDSRVKDVLQITRAVVQLGSDESAQRVAAIEALDGALYPEVRVSLNQFLEGFSDEDKVNRKAEYELAQNALTDIEKLVSLNGYAENLYFGLALGAVLLLAAIGLAITFGVMGVINMAHGEMIMLGAYTTYVVQQLMPDHIGLSLVVSIPAAFLVAGAVGVAIERGVIRHLYGRPLETLLATFGISLILQQAVRSVFSPLNREVATPDWMAGTFMLNPALELTWNRLYIIIFSLLVLATLALVLKRTLFGLNNGSKRAQERQEESRR